MKKTFTFTVFLILMVLLIVSCKAPAPESTAEADDRAVFTVAALTAQAKGLQILATTPPPVAPSGTPATTTPGTSGAESAATPAESTSEPSAGKGDLAEFVKDITIPDGTELRPNETFVKTWLLKNVGMTVWTTGYSLAFVGGDRMNAPEAIPLPQNVPPNETVEISVELTAPASPAHYTAYFNLQNPDGETFGVGVGGIEAFWVDIVVSEEAAPLATNTPAVSPDVVTQVFLYVDSASANECPHTYKFTGNITLSSPAPVTYRLEAGATDPGVQFDLPEPVTVDLGVGTHTFTYDLTFTSAVNGWVVLHVTSPADFPSNTVNITLNCQ